MTPEAQFEDICDELKVQMAPHLYEAVRVFAERLARSSCPPVDRNAGLEDAAQWHVDLAEKWQAENTVMAQWHRNAAIGLRALKAIDAEPECAPDEVIFHTDLPCKIPGMTSSVEITQGGLETIRATSAQFNAAGQELPAVTSASLNRKDDQRSSADPTYSDSAQCPAPAAPSEGPTPRRIEPQYLTESVSGKWVKNWQDRADQLERECRILTDAANISLKRADDLQRENAQLRHDLGRHMSIAAQEVSRRVEIERELAARGAYEKRLCAALGMKSVDPEEALNVIDGLRDVAPVSSTTPAVQEAWDSWNAGKISAEECLCLIATALQLQTPSKK